MPEEGSAARLVRNTLANGLGQVLGVAISLALTPFLITGLGIEAYGVFAIGLTLTFFGGYAGLADLGVEGAAVRGIAEARSDSDPRRVSEVVSTALGFFSGIALVVTPVLVALSGVLVDVFRVDPDLQSDARLTFALIALQLLFDLPARAFFAMLEGSQRFTVFQAIEASRALVLGLLFVAIVIAGPRLPLLAGAMVTTSAMVLVVAWIFARRAQPEVHVSPRMFRRSVLSELVTFGGGLFVLRLAGTFYRQMDKVIIGTVLGVRAVTPYEVANKIHAGASLVQSVSASALLPATAFARRRADIIRDLYLRGSCYTLAVTLPVIAAGTLLADDLIRTWVSEGIADEATGPLRLFFLYLAIVVPHVVGVSVLVGLGSLRAPLIVSLGVLVVNLGLSLALVSPLGISGVVLGTVISNALSFPYLLYVLTKRFDVDLREWFVRTIRPSLVGLAAQALTAVPILWAATQTGQVLIVGALFIASSLIGLAATLAWGLPREERRVLLETMRTAVGFGRPAGDQYPAAHAAEPPPTPPAT